MAKHGWRKGEQRKSTTQRGYGYAHQQERKRRLADTGPGERCRVCGKILPADTSEWHLPHKADRSGYLPGWWCGPCNRRDGAVRGRSRVRGTRQRPTTMEW